MTIVSVKRATAAASVVLLLAACTRSAPVPLAAPMAGKRVEGDRGMVAASHPDAAAAGAALLGQG
ncbi:MAG: hypothetical protein ACK5U0_14645, partial [Gemmatimonas sp.]